ncbi:hypothetical protein SAMN03159341_11611 [Paenibacillus sp. 1_12]|uniref:hypothetical protein n=1 Tax=Paenibacillus sp. 1_12 TaxID=1566278 RepID=UPI0008E39190|nr:hypothetical protein [Paenibacillus sp. 1_12]SFM08478.1 hypothetical protein SAMN03159341_11611 [Paenibacillus sp. 1_12]
MQQILMKLTTKQKKGLFVCAMLILGVYIVLTIYFGLFMSNAREQSSINHKNRMDATRVETKYPPQKSGFNEVKLGSYVENIRNATIADSSFSADLYIWFAWEGNKDLNPGETFQVIGGRMDSKELSSEHHLDDGRNYQRYKITVTMDKVYDTKRFSLEDHMLNIYIEDKKNDGAVINYVVDKNSAISSRVNIPGYRVTNFQEVVKPHEYKSTFSSPNANGLNRVFSQYAIAISINRTDWGFYLKIFMPYLLSVALGLIVLWTKSNLIDARTGLGGASFFGVVANAYVVSSYVPPNGGTFGLLDVLTITSLVSVFLIVAASILSYNLYTKQEKHELSIALDKVVFFCIAFGYLLLSIVLPFCAYSNV